MSDERNRPLIQPWGTGEVRLSDDGTIDEIVAKGVDFHLEQLSDTAWWMGLSLPDGRCLHVNLYSARSIRCNASDAGTGWKIDGREWGDFWGGPIEIPQVPEKPPESAQ